MPDLLRVLSDDIAAVDLEGTGLDDSRVLRLYEAMVTARALDHRCEALLDDGAIGFYVASRGTEAVSVGAAAALETQDWLFPSHRDVGMYLLRGGSLRSWLDQLFGNVTDLTKGRQLPGHHSLPDGRFVSVSAPVGSQIVQAAGCAMAIKHRQDGAAVLASFGEAAVAAGDFHAGLNIAATYRVPAVFLCRSVSSGQTISVGDVPSVAQRAAGYGVRAHRVDGTDLLAVYQATAEARRSAARGGGPTLIEAVLPVALADVDAAATVADPVHRMREFLEHSGAWDTAREETLAGALADRLEQAVGAAAAEGPPLTDTLFTDVYEELPWMLQEQRERQLEEEG